MAGNKLYCLAIGEPQQQARPLDMMHFAAIMVSSLMSVKMSSFLVKVSVKGTEMSMPVDMM